MHTQRVAVTGIGIVSSLGLSAEAVRDALREGRSGVEFVPERKERGLRSALSGRIRNFEAPKVPAGMKASQPGLSDGRGRLPPGRGVRRPDRGRPGE